MLASMPADVFARLQSHLQRIEIKRRAIVQERHWPVEHVYFIERGIASIFAWTTDDGPGQVALVGRFGLVGVSAVLGVSARRTLLDADGRRSAAYSARACRGHERERNGPPPAAELRAFL